MKAFLVKYDIGPEAKNWPSILSAPNSTSSCCVKLVRPLGVKGLGPI
jgi:hypothetical protein